MKDKVVKMVKNVPYWKWAVVACVVCMLVVAVVK